MDQQIPKRLRKEPLMESLWEIRFSNAVRSIAELLPGMLFKQFAKEFPKIETLPAANLPIVIRQADPNLRYVPTMRLEGELYSIQIGEQVVSLSCRRPYTGWQAFGSKIRELATALQDTGLFSKPERFSMKYIDLLPSTEAPTIAPLSATISLGNRDIGDDAVHLRSERKENEFIHIVQIMSPAEVRFPNGDEFKGILIDIDTIYPILDVDAWVDFNVRLDQLHDLNKKIFFELLKPETIQSLEPEY